MPHRYSRNVLTLIGGAAMAQFLPVLVSPILTRFFSPADFGVYALFTAAVSVCAACAAGRYDMAIMQPADDGDAAGLWRLGVAVAALVGLTLLALLHGLANLLDVEFTRRLAAGPLPYLVPLSVFCLAVFNCCSQWLNRHQRYGLISGLRVMQGAVIAAASVFGALVMPGTYGLVWAASLGNVLVAVAGVGCCLRPLAGAAPARDTWRLAVAYRKYPLVSMPTGLLNSGVLQAPALFFSHFFSSAVTGFYGLAFRVLAGPTSIVATSVGQIYFQRVSVHANHNPGAIVAEIRRTALRLGLLSVTFFLPVLLFGEALFALVFGEPWRTAGYYAGIMAVSASIKFVVSPLSTTFMAVDRQTTLAKWQIAYFATAVTTLGLGARFGPETLLWLLAAHDFLMYGVCLLLVLRVGRAAGEHQQNQRGSQSVRQQGGGQVGAEQQRQQRRNGHGQGEPRRQA